MCLKESSATKRMWLGENGEVRRSRSGHFLPGRVYIRIDSFSLGSLSRQGFQPSHHFFLVKSFDAIFFGTAIPLSLI